jgi:hypothetical protein
MNLQRPTYSPEEMAAMSTEAGKSKTVMYVGAVFLILVFLVAIYIHFANPGIRLLDKLGFGGASAVAYVIMVVLFAVVIALLYLYNRGRA